MVEIIWDPKAIEDLNLIFKYIKRDSLEYAESVVKKISDRVDLLEKFPSIGRIVPEFNKPEYRELIEQNYRIIYKVKDSITILAIFHGKQRFTLRI
jgi:toxin ParE1/3/4